MAERDASPHAQRLDDASNYQADPEEDGDPRVFRTEAIRE
jgi:hypothetical protein